MENYSYFMVKPKSNIWHLYKKRRKNTETHTEEKATYRCMKFKVGVPIDEGEKGGHLNSDKQIPHLSQQKECGSAVPSHGFLNSRTIKSMFLWF